MPGDGVQKLGWLGTGSEARGGDPQPVLAPLCPALQMEQALDTGVLGQLVGPGGSILSTVRNPSGSLLTLKGRAILCILRALVGKTVAQGARVGRKRVQREVLPRALPSSPVFPAHPL